MFKKVFVLVAAVMAVSTVTAMACDNGASSASGNTGAMINATTPQQVTLKGVLSCSSCSLKSEGARSACSEFGCTHALKTEDGRLVSLMQNKFSADLISNKKNHDKPIEITGTFFANANVLDVKSYTLDKGKTISWCDHCKGMDACMASSH